MKKLIMLLVTLIILSSTILLPACTSNSTTTTTTTTTATTRTVIDMAGREVVIPMKVNRIAIAFQATNQIIHMLGSPEKICATVPLIKTNPWYVKIYPQIMDVPTPFDWGGTTGVINFEEVVKTQPDVVLLYQDTGSDLDKFKELGIPVIMVPAFATPEAIMKSVLFIGEVLGPKEKARAEQFVEYYEANIARATAISSAIPKDQILKVYYATDTTDPLKTEGKNEISVSWMSHGGGINVAAEAGITGRSTKVNIEDILEWNPDAIVCCKAGAYNAILSDPNWSGINAVKNGRVYLGPVGMYWWTVRSTEEALMTLWIGTMLHPQEYSSIDMVKEVKDFYQRFHNYTLTDDDAESILHPPTQ
jgi:iron complex transport system substrate-binding protein